MKKIMVLAGLAFSLFATFDSQAQVRVSLNIGTPVVQQSWYANDNDYYYMPEQGVYYNVRRRVYVYPESGRWMYANQLPSRYGNYTYRNSRYVQVRDRSPFDRDIDYQQRYRVDNNRGGYGNGNNPHYNGRHDNGNHYGRDRYGRGDRDNRGYRGDRGYQNNGDNRDNRGSQNNGDNRGYQNNGGTRDGNRDNRTDGRDIRPNTVNPVVPDTRQGQDRGNNIDGDRRRGR
jgi:hypothetical protein